ncbi:MAG: hypothetical protein K2W82_17370 [Candidatus Obscuribacterales bacterium]|nr:hypothetical protein [Candidatus Obscuribacterales bacterium]
MHVANSLHRSGILVKQSWHECTVLIKSEDAQAVLTWLQASSLIGDSFHWSGFGKVHLQVLWSKDGREKSERTVVICTSDEAKNEEFDALRRDACMRRHYEPRSVLYKQFARAFPAPIKDSLNRLSRSLFQKEEIRHPRGTSYSSETVWLVAGRKEYFLKAEEAIVAARAELEALLLDFGTKFYENAWAAEAREALAVVLTELPANFHETLVDVVPYLAERMKEEVATRIRARNEVPREPRRW